jgi:hypothetical protein
MGLDGKATWAEQIVQIGVATEHLGATMRILESVGIASEVFEYIKQMDKLMGQFRRIMDMDVPFEVTTNHSVTLDNSLKWNDDVMQWRMDFLQEVDELRSEIALDNEQSKVLASAANMIIEPLGVVSAIQANTLTEMADTERARRQDALAALDSKVAWVEKKMELAAAARNEALVRCITRNIGCG